MSEQIFQGIKLKTFSRYPKKIPPFPHLVQIQHVSYAWFIEKGLKELLAEFSPVKDYSEKKLSLEFVSYKLEEPEYSEREAMAKNITYEAPLRVNCRLTNLQTKEIKEQEVYFSHLPVITQRGTFIINGIERAVVSQLIRSPGLYFTLQGQKKDFNLFGAQLIPSRGAWLEFSTESDGAITVKIDKKRKLPATSLLRAFGVEKDEEIIALFKEIDNGPVSFIEKTLAIDQAKNKIEGRIEVFKRLRPGELAAEDNSNELFQKTFSIERYDLEKVGRWKFCKRLNIPMTINKISLTDRVIKAQDVVLIVKEIIKLNNDPNASSDDIDHLANRRVRPVGILLQEKLRGALTRIERIIKDRMSTLDIDTITPSHLIHSNPFTTAIQEFFGISRLSQFMDQINPLSELEHKRRLSAKGPGGLSQERAGFEVRDVHTSHYGRICPIQTPEGPNIGLVTHLTSYSRLDELGFIETPYFKVKGGEVTDEVVYLNAQDEQNYNIAHGGEMIDENGRFVNEMVGVRYQGEPRVVSREEVQLFDVSPEQIVSVATAMIPFLEHDDANRALMGSNMQRQAVPCILPEPPLVATGMEIRAATDSGYIVFAKGAGKVVAAGGGKVTIKYDSGKKETFEAIKYTKSNQYTCINQNLRVSKGDKVKKGDILLEGPAIKDGILSLGHNLLVAFLPWQGNNYEDAIIISERLVREDYFTSVHIEDFVCDVRETKLGPEITTYDIPNVSESKLANLDEQGIIRIGAEVHERDILVGKISPKGEVELTGEERLLRAVFGEKAQEVRDTSLILPHGKRGRVIGVKIFSRDKGDKLQPGVIKSIQVKVAVLRKIQVGDKLAGRHGNKGVIAKILSVEDMPFLEDGTPIDIILNPLGVASRMNIGQILEMHLGWAAHKLKYIAINPVFCGATEKEIKEELKKAGLPEDGKVVLRDGRTGEPFAQKVAVGMIYMMKLNHLVEDKVHARSIGSYSLTTQQPLGGKAQFGGQRFGEMEVWALEGYGAAHTLQEILTIKSDDVLGRAKAYEAITKGEKIKKPGVPESFNVLLAELKGLCLEPELITEQAADVE